MSDVSRRLASSATTPDGWAYLDWLTGLVRIDCTIDEWKALKSKPPSSYTARETLLTETVTHEFAHYFQVCTTGYLYRVATELFSTFAESMPHDAREFDDLTTDVLEATAFRLNRIKEERLLRIGEEGLDVVSIVEGAAFLIQKLYHYPGQPAEFYERQLAGQSRVFTAAFDVAHRYLGAEAVFCLPTLASLSMWTSDPPLYFVELCDALAASPDGAKITFPDLVNVLARCDEFIGPPWLTVGARSPPEFNRSVRRMEELREEGRFDRDLYLARPFLQNDNDRVLIDEALPPIIFNGPRKGDVALQWYGAWEANTNRATTYPLLQLFALSTHIQRMVPRSS